MKKWKYLLPGMAALIVACSSNGNGSDDDKTGKLSLSLTAADDAGEIYRLRSASFYIYGYPQYSFPGSGGAGGAEDSYYYSETVSTEDAPNAPEIVTRVVPGYYYVTFNTGEPWYIEHLTSHGPERVQQSVLLSQPQQYAYVYDRNTTHVQYQFGVDGRTIDFRHGDIVIGIGIEHPDGAGGQPGAGGSSF